MLNSSCYQTATTVVIGRNSGISNLISGVAAVAAAHRRRRRGREVATAASRTRRMQNQPRLNTLNMKSVLTNCQYSNLFPFRELCQANRTLCLHTGEFRFHFLREHQRRSHLQFVHQRRLRLVRKFLLPAITRIVIGTAATAEEAADGGVESESADEPTEEDDDDDGGVGFEVSGIGVRPPSTGAEVVTRRRWRWLEADGVVSV